MLVATNLLTVSQAASRLGIGRDAVLMAIRRGTIAPEQSLKDPNGKVLAHLFTEDEVERYARETLGKHGPKSKPLL